MNEPQNIASRLWQKDAALWRAEAAPEIGRRLGWLDAIEWSRARADALLDFAAEVRRQKKFQHIIVLGMGGASLAAKVFASMQPPAPPQLHVLDSIAPDQIRAIDQRMLKSALFVVASKSGGSIETLDLLDYFYARVQTFTRAPGAHFVTVTDADGDLHQIARELKFARIFLNRADVGGRYAALTLFGLLPAALAGVDVKQVLAHAAEFAAQCKHDSPAQNPALALGQHLGRAWLAGKMQMHLRLPPDWHAFGAWVEQLIAESTGKCGKGLLPVLAESSDAVRVEMRAEVCADDAAELQWRVGAPPERHVGVEFFRWQFAAAAAAAYLRVNPFDEPDVETSKQRAREFIADNRALESVAPMHTLHDDAMFSAYAAKSQPARSFAEWFAAIKPDDYLALIAHLPDIADTRAALQQLQRQLAQKFQRAVTLGFAPGCLHSTGQLHKGGAARGHFLQIMDADAADLKIPARAYTFGELLRAQAAADFVVLAQKPRPILQLRLKGDRLRSLAALQTAMLNHDK